MFTSARGILRLRYSVVSSQGPGPRPSSLLSRARPRAYFFLANRIGALVGVDDLTAGGKPDAVVLLDVGEGALQIFDAQRLADDHRMQWNAHDPRLLLLSA